MCLAHTAEYTTPAPTIVTTNACFSDGVVNLDLNQEWIYNGIYGPYASYYLLDETNENVIYFLFFSSWYHLWLISEDLGSTATVVAYCDQGYYYSYGLEACDWNWYVFSGNNIVNDIELRVRNTDSCITNTPTHMPTSPQTATSSSPTNRPSRGRTPRPTRRPTTKAPTVGDKTQMPSKSPTIIVTNDPTRNPADLPTDMPTDMPTDVPTDKPTSLVKHIFFVHFLNCFVLAD